MKKFIMVMLVALLTFGVVFASENNRWNLGASFGTASMNEITFNSGDVKIKNGTLGIGADFRADYELVEDVYLTGVLGWQMPDRNFIVKDPTYLGTTSEKKQHYLTILAGASMGHMKVDEKKHANGDNTTTATDIVWTGTVGPELAINLTKGKVGGGVGAMFKGSYFLSHNVSLDLGVNVALLGIKDSPADNKVHWFCNYGVKLGGTYKF